MRISDWSSDVCSSDRAAGHRRLGPAQLAVLESEVAADDPLPLDKSDRPDRLARRQHGQPALLQRFVAMIEDRARGTEACGKERSEEHTSELQSLMRISYAVFCLKKKTQQHKLKRKSTQV